MNHQQRCDKRRQPWSDFDGIRAAVLDAIELERERQDEKFGGYGHPESGMPSGDHDVRNRILGEEVGEVAKALNEHDTREHLREELIQVAAVCVAWVEFDMADESLGIDACPRDALS